VSAFHDNQGDRPGSCCSRAFFFGHPSSPVFLPTTSPGSGCVLPVDRRYHQVLEKTKRARVIAGSQFAFNFYPSDIRRLPDALTPNALAEVCEESHEQTEIGCDEVFHCATFLALVVNFCSSRDLICLSSSLRFPYVACAVPKFPKILLNS